MTINEIIQEIITLCRQHHSREVILFGSRAKGTAGPRSDIDIAVRGAADFELLSEQIQLLPTLYTIDLVNLDACRNQLLMEDITIYGRKIYEKI